MEQMILKETVKMTIVKLRKQKTLNLKSFSFAYLNSSYEVL